MFNYYAGTANRPMQALCLTGAGDAHAAQGEAELALERYQQSLAISVEAQNVPAMHAGTYGAGTSCLALGRDEEAEGYLRHANGLAGKLDNPYAKADALEKLGVARFRQGKVQEAVDAWLKGKGLARQFDYDERAASILDQLIFACQSAGLEAQQHELERERAGLGTAPHGPGAAHGASV